VKATRDNELIRTARTVLRLQRQIAKYRRQIRKAQAELKHERKVLRGLAYAADNQQSAPSRLTAGATGYAAPGNTRPADTTPVEDITVGFEG
jgi:hypothetical protein